MQIINSRCPINYPPMKIHRFGCSHGITYVARGIIVQASSPYVHFLFKDMPSADLLVFIPFMAI